MNNNKINKVWGVPIPLSKDLVPLLNDPYTDGWVREKNASSETPEEFSLFTMKTLISVWEDTLIYLSEQYEKTECATIGELAFVLSRNRNFFEETNFETRYSSHIIECLTQARIRNVEYNSSLAWATQLFHNRVEQPTFDEFESAIEKFVAAGIGFDMANNYMIAGVYDPDAITLAIQNDIDPELVKSML